MARPKQSFSPLPLYFVVLMDDLFRCELRLKHRTAPRPGVSHGGRCCPAGGV